MKSLILYVIITLSLPVLLLAQVKRDCKVTFKISGERNDGKGNYENEMEVTHRCYDFDEAGIKKQLADDKWRYGEYDYKFISNPTQKQDCAGYTFQKLFNKGPYWITSQAFYDKLILFFGKQIRSLTDPFGWGDVREGDVLVYRKGGSVNHITYVSKVNSTLGVVTSVVIDTKDAKEGVYQHKIGLMNDQTDPLIRGLGEIAVYRLDPGKLQITELTRTCDCEQKGRGWQLESLIIDPDKKSGKWDENHTVTITENSVIATAYKSKLTLTITSPPQFIKDGEEAIIEVTTTYEGDDNDVELSFLLMAGYFSKTSDKTYDEMRVGKMQNAKFQRNTAKTVIKLKNGSSEWPPSIASMSASFSIYPLNIAPRIFQAKYKRKE